MIGVFDSGNGGLVILRALRERLPERDIVYLGDHRHAPYGECGIDEIRALTGNGIDLLFELGCQVVIVACNTAAAAALRHLQQDWLPSVWPNRRLLGVFVPMVEAVAGVPWRAGATTPSGGGPRATVGVFATVRTVLTCAWRDEIHRLAPDIQVIQQQCPGLADMIEADADGDVVDAAVGQFASWLLARTSGEPDAVVLGCTHYALITDRFAAALPPTVRILDQPTEVARATQRYLRNHPEFAPMPGENGRTRFLSTGTGASVDRVAERFMGTPVAYEHLPTRLVA